MNLETERALECKCHPSLNARPNMSHSLASSGRKSPPVRILLSRLSLIRNFYTTVYAKHICIKTNGSSKGGILGCTIFLQVAFGRQWESRLEQW